MINTLLGLVAPYHCCGCGEVGSLLCDNCKYDITNDAFSGCLLCRRPSRGTGICSQCKPPYERAWCVSERAGSLERLIDDYKFNRAKGGSVVLGDLLHTHLPELPPEVTIVPIPTVASHIRQRGYDHAYLMARALARRRRMPLRPLLRRASSATQHGATRRDRLAQAKRAFAVNGMVDQDRVYLLIDDIMTTGFTLQYAAKQLRDYGARHVWVAVVARQPLEK